MKIKLQTIHCEVPDKVQKFIEEQVLKLGTKFTWIEEAFIYLKEVKNDRDLDKIVELQLRIPGPDIHAKGQDKYFELACRGAILNAKRQLKKHKETDFAHPKKNPFKL